MNHRLYQDHFSSFFNVPFAVYGEDYPFVSPLRSDLKAMVDFKRNPFFAKGDGTYWSVVRGNKPVGRLMAVVHKDAITRRGEQVCSFGFFDSEDNPDVVEILVGAIQEFAAQKGCTTLRGNMNPTTHQETGVLTRGDHLPPFLGQAHSPEYLGPLLETMGFRAIRPMTTFFHGELQRADPEAALGPKHRELLANDAYTFRTFDPEVVDREVDAIREVFNASMTQNYLFAPMSAEQAKFQFRPLKRLIDPTLLQMAEHEGEVVAVALCVPDAMPLLRKIRSRSFPWGWWTFSKEKKDLKGASLIALMVKPDHQRLGLTRLLTSRMLAALKAGGYLSLGSGRVGDKDIASIKSMRALGMTPYHKLLMYEKKLG